jgi:hypothetical protein
VEQAFRPALRPAKFSAASAAEVHAKTDNREPITDNRQPNTNLKLETLFTTLAFAVLIGGVLIVRFRAPVLPVLIGCIGAVLATLALKSLRARR